MGGRLSAMLNGIRVARDYDLPFFVGWTTHGRTSEELKAPDEIFDPDFVRDKFFDVEVMADIWPHLVDLNALQPPYDEADFRQQLARGRTFLSEVAYGRIVLPWEDRDDIEKRLPGCVADIPFSPVVRRAMEMIEQRLEGRNLSAYHIRRGDIISSPITSQKLWPNKYIPRVFYETHLKRSLERADAACIVFSDTAAETDSLKSLDPRVMSFEDVLGDMELSIGQRDFLELFAMSRCRQIFGPPSSAFSQAAATIGGGTVKEVELALSPTDRVAALELLTERIETKPQIFLGDGDLGQNLPFMVGHHVQAGTPDRARDILAKRVRDGFSRDYVYDLLCELMAATGRVEDCEEVRSRAYARAIHTDDAVAQVNAYASMGLMRQGDFDTALKHAMTAAWLRPLEDAVHTSLNLLAGTGQMDLDLTYPFDPALGRTQGARKTIGDYGFLPHMAVFADTPFADRSRLVLPWDLTVRDWRHIHGKKLTRAFSNRSRIIQRLDRFKEQFRKIEGTPAFLSAVGVQEGAAGRFDQAEALLRSAIAQEPENPLYRKRVADVLAEKGDMPRAIQEMEAATEASGGHLCYVASLAFMHQRARNRDQMTEQFLKTTERPHHFIEIKLLAAEALRAKLRTREKGLATMLDAVAQAPGSIRLLNSLARFYVQIEQVEDALKLYETIAASNLATPYQMVMMYRNLMSAGRETELERFVAMQSLSMEEIRAQASGP